MNKDRVVVMGPREQPYTKEYVNQLRAMAKANVAKITEKPTLESLYKTVDVCWENPIFQHQTQFKNKDQHYAYVTEYYHSVIEKQTLDEYKQMVLQDILSRLEKAENLLDSDKILAAAKEHKKQEQEHLKHYQDELDSLKERNDSLTKEALKDISGEKHD